MAVKCGDQQLGEFYVFSKGRQRSFSLFTARNAGGTAAHTSNTVIFGRQLNRTGTV